MGPEDKRILKRTLDLAESNNKILKKLYQGLIWQRIGSFIYWFFVIGAAVGLYYYVQPIFDSLDKIYENVTGQSFNPSSLFDGWMKKQ